MLFFITLNLLLFFIVIEIINTKYTNNKTAMPTVILLDVSLSMSRLASSSNDHGMKLIDIASSCLINFVEKMSEQAKLEYTALVIFSSLYEVKVRFTRDYEAIKKACNSVTTYDKTVFESAFQAVEMLVMEEWGPYTPVELILVTDGQTGVGEGSLKDLFNTTKQQDKSKFPVPFSFPCHFSIVTLSPSSTLPSNGVGNHDLTTTTRDTSKAHFEQLIEMNYKKGDLYVPETITVGGVSKCFNRILNTRYCVFETTLKCGHFQSGVTLFPPPMIQNSFSGLTNLYKHPNDTINFTKLKTGMTIILDFIVY